MDSWNGVTISRIQKNSWQENGYQMYDYNIKIANASGRMISRIRLEPKVSIRDCWNLSKIEDGLYITDDWMQINNGGTCQEAGYIAFGASAPRIAGYTKADGSVCIRPPPRDLAKEADIKAAFREWTRKRRDIIHQLRSAADEIQSVYKSCNIAPVVNSSVTTTGAVLGVASLFLPFLAPAGKSLHFANSLRRSVAVAATVGGTVSSIGTSVAGDVITAKLRREVNEALVSEEQNSLVHCMNLLTKYLQIRKEIKLNGRITIPEASSLYSGIEYAVPSLGLASEATALVLRVNPTRIGVAATLAGANLVLEVVNIVFSSIELSEDTTNCLTLKIRDAANALENEMHRIERCFNNLLITWRD